MTIAFIAGRDYDPTPIRRYLSEHVGDVLVTGATFGEQYASQVAESLGIEVRHPELHSEWFGKSAKDCQVNDILAGADAIVIGGKVGTRARLALDIWKRCDSWRDEGREVTYL